MESMVDCLLDSAGAERASGPPFGSTVDALQGALRVNKLSTAAGFAWKIALRFSTPPLAKSQSSAVFA
jgi:hypothetical protein